MKRHPRRTDEEWLNIIQQCRTSGMADKHWCLDHGIQPSKFYYHIRRLRAKYYRITERDSSQTSITAKQEVAAISFSGQTLIKQPDETVLSADASQPSMSAGKSWYAAWPTASGSFLKQFRQAGVRSLSFWMSILTKWYPISRTISPTKQICCLQKKGLHSAINFFSLNVSTKAFHQKDES